MVCVLPLQIGSRGGEIVALRPGRDDKGAIAAGGTQRRRRRADTDDVMVGAYFSGRLSGGGGGVAAAKEAELECTVGVMDDPV